MYTEDGRWSAKWEWNTPIHEFMNYRENHIFVKREDLIPYSFGGNKARKAALFFEDFDKSESDCVLTYGSSHSNHCRIVANLAAGRRIPCHIIAPVQVSDITYNSRLMELFGARIKAVTVENVSNAIKQELTEMQTNGLKPYFIPGGGHGNIGTRAYVQCYREIKEYENEHEIYFDYIFFASGTGTTQAGLICGQMLNNDDRKIIGISIARKNPRGKDAIISSIREYMALYGDISGWQEKMKSCTIFLDDYIKGGYGKDDFQLWENIKSIMAQYGIPLDSTYTGKAFMGMKDYIERQSLTGKQILFIHTGGTPLFFDDINQYFNVPLP